MSWNLENFFLLPKKVDQAKALFPPNLQAWLKPRAKVSAVADTIRRYRPHIIFLQEVGGVSALQSFCAEFFPDDYDIFHLEGNSERGIEVAYLVRKNLPFQCQLISHARHKLDLSHLPHPNINYHPFFERNVLELRMTKETYTFSLFGVHLKSAYDPTGKDPEGRLKRSAEIKGLVQIVQKAMATEIQDYILLGDFNGLASPETPSPEFKPLYELPGVRELLQLIGTPRSERGTFLHSVLRELQLDYIFLSPNLAAQVEHEQSGIIHLRDIGGGPFRWPMSTAAKQSFASDHLPLLCSLSTLTPPKP